MKPQLYCATCGCETKVTTKKNLLHVEPKNGAVLKLIDKYNIPFICSVCKGLDFPYQALHSAVFVWPDALPDRTSGGIILPEKLRSFFGSEYGIVLSLGKDVVVDIKVGSRVLYDKSVPWELEVIDSSGKRQIIKNMSIKDIKGVVDNGL